MVYEKIYKQALERAKALYDNELSSADTLIACEAIFPELTEPEDEWIRKELIAFLKENHETGRADETWSLSGIERWIAWLEKQGEQKKDVRLESLEKLLEADSIYQMAMNDAMVEEAKNKAVKALQELAVSKLLGLEKQGSTVLSNSSNIGTDKQKPTDYVEPKFKLGDKIRRKTPSSCDKDMQVARIDKDYYICNHIGKFSSEVVPFSKESSYELVEQKPTWSEEDERLRKTTIAFLKDFAEQGYENAVECIDWLEKQVEQKSLSEDDEIKL